MDLDATGQGLAGHFFEVWLGVEQVHLAGSAILDELDDGFGFGGKVDGPGLEVIGRAGTQQVSQHETAKAQGGAFEDPAASVEFHRSCWLVYQGPVIMETAHEA